MILSNISSKLFAGTTVAALVLAGAFAIKNAQLRTSLADQRAKHENQLRKISDGNVEALASAIKRGNEKVAELAAANRELEKEKQDAKAANDDLRAKYANERRLRLNGATCTSGNSGPKSELSSTGSMADAGQEVTFSSELRQAIFDTRELIAEDQVIISGLQRYIRISCLKP